MNKLYETPDKMGGKVVYNDGNHKEKTQRKLLIPLLIIGLSLILNQAHLGQYYYPGKKAHYTQEYIEENKGKVIVEIPEVYELANIAIAITDYGLNSPYRVYKKGEYYERVLKHFLPFKKHPLISKIEFSDEKLSLYFSFRENSACYIFKNDSIIQGGVYPYTWAWSPNLFKKHVKLIEDFAKVSQFSKFYRDNLPYYKKQIRKYKEKVPIKKMWTWLEKNFPNRYNCYKIIFSPLIYASHSTKRFEDEDFREIVMFVSGPEIYKNKYSGKVEEGLLSRVVFTEIDHNYVNPITNQYLERVNKVFSNVEKWNKQSGYPFPFLIFNEYMTWAVFTLYAYDNYEREDFEKINQRVVKTMVNSRKFVLFKQFNDKFLELYLNRKKDETIPDLYPKILGWVEKIKSEKRKITTKT
ncbi:MAG: DUF4932 domain-containing protein [Candidatus Aminicenantia bacterium]